MIYSKGVHWLDDENNVRSAKSFKVEKETPAEDTKEFALKVEIDDAVYQKIMHWIDKAPGEVSGLGTVEFDASTNTLRVTEAILLKQKNTGVTTELDGHAVGKAMFLMKDAPGTLRWWWHSHVNMDVFWSSTDMTTIKQLGGGGWFLATVFNKRREMKSAYCQNGPVRLFIDDIETEVTAYIDEELQKKWDKEYEANCSEEKPTFHYKINVPSDEEIEKELSKCDNFPKEADENKIEFNANMNYLSLEELFDLKEKGECPEEVFQKAYDSANEEEIRKFYKAKWFDIHS